MSDDFPAMPEICRQLQEAFNLQYVAMSNRTATLKSVHQPLAWNPRVKVIQVRSLGVYTLSAFVQRIDEVAKPKICLGEGKKSVVTYISLNDWI